MTPETGAFLIEIGCEDLPDWTADFLSERWLPALGETLKASRLPCRTLRLLCTPRRIVLIGEGIPVRQPDREVEVTGPPAAVAIDTSGRFTQAAVKFARANGADESCLRIVEKGGRKVVAITRREAGAPAPEILARVVPDTLAAIEIPRAMRWTDAPFRFFRPVRWVCALWNDRPMEIVVAGVNGGAETMGHRSLSTGRIPVAKISDYLSTLRAHSVLVDEEERTQRLASLIAAALPDGARADGAEIRKTVRFVEYPCLEVGEIAESFAALPAEVIDTVVRKLKCIPLPGSRRFLIITDGVSGGGVRSNYESVLSARLQDAAFFMEQDGKRRLADFGDNLGRILFHPRWGSVRERVERIIALAGFLSKEMRLAGDTAEHLLAAARLCKNDLATLMVAEFPALQGTIGRIYASREGLPAPVCRALEEHYWPRFSGDRLPGTPVGALLAVIDRMDLLCCFLAEGGEKVGSADPFGLRRAGTGIIEIVWSSRLAVPLRALARHAASLLGTHGTEDAVMAFLRQRTENLLAAGSIPAGVRRGVLAAAGEDFLAAREKATAFLEFLGQPGNAEILVPFSRVANILAQAASRGEKPAALRTDLLTEEAERDLYRRVEAETPRLRNLHAEGRYAEFLSGLRAWKEPIDRFFDDVLVMCPDQDLRANRLALLSAVNDVFLLFADFSQIT